MELNQNCGRGITINRTEMLVGPIAPNLFSYCPLFFFRVDSKKQLNWLTIPPAPTSGGKNFGIK
jgi:hypothetical protein